ncbi:MAG: MazG-like family protein [Promethearchaeota archaeon]
MQKKSLEKKKLDSMTTIEDLRKLTANFVNERDWKSYHKPRALAEAISIESAELLEQFLFQPPDYVPENIELLTDEMSDIFIYLMSLCNALKLPSFSQEVFRKMEKNKQKYPISKYSGENYQKQ